MDNLKKDASAAADAGDSMIAQAEKKPCQYCRPEASAESSLSNCAYCQKIDEPSEGLADCPYCAEMDAGSEAGACKYCDNMGVQAEAGPHEHNPTTTDSEDFAGQNLDSPAIPKPIPGEEPQGIAPNTDSPTNNNLNIEGQGEITVTSGQPPSESVQVDQSKEAMVAIAQQIEGAASPQEAAQQVDSTQLAVGTEMQGNVSHPAGYEENTPSDMGLAEGGEVSGEPDLTSVLHEGLDAHSDNIQRERVVQMVSQALQGFKACKSIIERSQQQAPQLYQSSIMMLKAMIEMAKMLGLGPQEETPANPLESQAGNEWQDPFPTHPDQGGAPAPAYAPADNSASHDGDANNGNEWSNPFPTHSENGGQAGIGQGVGKLPTSATTEHVARTPLAPGAVNAQGQKKYVDPVTGKESFINMKEGRVLSPTGKPVKPQQV